ncbi:hypothetical protein HW555_013436 [Spodoptera exigua]|uniref:Peptidase A2 domain-containing protein n=1 Tax=Spodoptera exigua TaxID=7107 RepID=A0A835G3H3_SPOEX|nr:hypothetical protein HW555_013436 [Spodoptera exigua]
MEGAIETQYQIMQAMNNVLTNFKKDGPSRKTPTNIKKKIDLLDKYWAEFQNNHEKICERENLTHPYFAQDSYEQTKEFYNSTRDYLVKYLNLDQKPVSPMLKSSAWTYDPTPSTSHKAESEPIQEQGDDGKGTTPLTIQVPEVPEPETNSKVSEMLRKQRSNIKAFQRNASNNNLDVLKDKWQFEDALQVLELRWKAVDTLYWELDSLPNNTDIQYEMSYNTCEIIYNEMKTKINSKMWSSLDDPRELPKIQDFLNFLEGKFVSWESSRRKPESSRTSYQPESVHSNKKFHNSYKAFSTHHQNVNDNEGSTKCPHCNQEHKLFSCKTFLELQPEAKRKAVAKYNLCINCLQAHRNECMSRKRCRVCRSDHNTLLHDAYSKGNGQTSNHRPAHQNSVTDSKSKITNSSSNHVSQEDLSETLLTTVLIKVKAYDGTLIVLRALLDQGSQTSLITERAAQLLKLPRSRCKGVIFGVGATENNCKGSITITCSAIHNDYTFDTNVFIMRNLVNKLPNKSFKKPESWTFLENISLADPEFYVSRPVDILLGAEIYSNIIQEGIIRQDNSLPVAQQTRLGWILCGNVQTFHCNVVINNTDDIQKFWLIEDIAENSTMSQDDLDAVQYYKETTTRNKDGRYIVKIPFQTNFQERLGESKSMASAQFRSLEKKFSKQPQLAETYTNFIQEYKELKHMIECTKSAINRQHKVIHQHLNNLTKATNTLSKNLQEQEVLNELALSTIIATNMLSKLKSIQDILIDSITDIHHGMLNAHVLSPGQLRDQLSIISGQLSRELSLPIENAQTELSKVFPLLRVKARMTKQYLIFEIRIPLVNRERYDLYQLIPIPGQQDNITITVIPVSDYIAIDLRKDTYLTMTKQDIQQCIQNGEYNRLCQSRKPVFQFKSEDSLCVKNKYTDRCLTDVAACRNNWIELNKINTYLFHCCGQCTIRIICERQITATQITKAGVIALNSDCVIKGQDFTVFSHKMQYSEMNTAAESLPEVIAPINEIINVSVPQVNLTYIDEQDSLQHIKEQIDQMKSEKALLPDMSTHDIHQYAIIYILLLGAVISALAFTFRWYCRRGKGSTNLQSDFERPQPVPIAAMHQQDNASCTPATRPRREPPLPHNQESVELSNFSRILSSMKRHKNTPPIFTKSKASDNGAVANGDSEFDNTLINSMVPILDLNEATVVAVTNKASFTLFPICSPTLNGKQVTQSTICPEKPGRTVSKPDFVSNGNLAVNFHVNFPEVLYMGGSNAPVKISA